MAVVVISVALFLGLLTLAALLPKQRRSELEDHTHRHAAMTRALSPKDSL